MSELSTIELVMVLIGFFTPFILVLALMINIWITDHLEYKRRREFIQRQIDICYSEMNERNKKKKESRSGTARYAV